MLLRVIHETAYDYAPAVRTAQHMAYLKPAHNEHQRLLAHRLTVTPEPVQWVETPDAWGNTRTYFSLQSAHERLVVRAESMVDTRAPRPPQDDAPWEDVRERLRYRRGGHWEAAAEFRFGSAYVPRHEDFAAYARPSFPPGGGLLAGARDLAARIHEDFRYEAQATDAGTPALEALALRKGVCQDFAHVMLGCLRSLGLPGRYVSGYLLTTPPPGQPRLVGGDASHAWVSVHVPAADGPGHWCDLDPTNDRAPAEDYVQLATGRDYADVSPLRGVIHGGARHTLRVGVTVEPAVVGPPYNRPPFAKDLP